MKRSYIIVEHRNPEYVKTLRVQLQEAHQKINNLSRELHALEIRYGYEVNLNNELVDLCRSHGVPFRETLDFKRHPF